MTQAYSCHNNLRPVAGAVTHVAQSGWKSAAIKDVHGDMHHTRIPVMVPIKHTMSTTCQYDKGTTDPRCAGCEHIKQGDV